MRLHEFSNHFKTFQATVRVVLRDSSMTARTTITADTVLHAKALLTRTFGDGNVLNINQVMNEDEEVTEGTKTLSPQDLQVKSLSDKAKQYKEQAKAMKARQQIAKAQQDLMKVSRGHRAS